MPKKTKKVQANNTSGQTNRRSARLNPNQNTSSEVNSSVNPIADDSNSNKKQKTKQASKRKAEKMSEPSTTPSSTVKPDPEQASHIDKKRKLDKDNPKSVTSDASKSSDQQNDKALVDLSTHNNMTLFQQTMGKALKYVLQTHPLDSIFISTRLDALTLLNVLARQPNLGPNSAFSMRGMKINFHHQGLYKVISESTYDVLVNNLKIDKSQEITLLKMLIASSNKLVEHYANDIPYQTADQLVKLYNLEASRRLSGGVFNYINICLYLYGNANAANSNDLVNKIFLTENVMAPKGASSKSENENSGKKERYIRTLSIVGKLLSASDEKLPPSLLKLKAALQAFKNDMTDENKHKKLLVDLTALINDWNAKNQNNDKMFRLDANHVSGGILEIMKSDEKLKAALMAIKGLESFTNLIKSFQELMNERYTPKVYETKDLNKDDADMPQKTNIKAKEIKAVNQEDDEESDNSKDSSKAKYKAVDVAYLSCWLISQAASAGHEAALNDEMEAMKNQAKSNNENVLISIFSSFNKKDVDITAKHFVAALRLLMDVSKQSPILEDVSINIDSLGGFFIERIGRYKKKENAIQDRSITAFNRAYQNNGSLYAELFKANSPAVFEQFNEPKFARIWKLVSILEIVRNPQVGGMYLAMIHEGFKLDSKTSAIKPLTLSPLTVSLNPMSGEGASGPVDSDELNSPIREQMLAIRENGIFIKGMLGYAYNSMQSQSNEIINIILDYLRVDQKAMQDSSAIKENGNSNAIEDDKMTDDGQHSSSSKTVVDGEYDLIVDASKEKQLEVVNKIINGMKPSLTRSLNKEEVIENLNQLIRKHVFPVFADRNHAANDILAIKDALKKGLYDLVLKSKKANKLQTISNEAIKQAIDSSVDEIFQEVLREQIFSSVILGSSISNQLFGSLTDILRFQLSYDHNVYKYFNDINVTKLIYEYLDDNSHGQPFLLSYAQKLRHIAGEENNLSVKSAKNNDTYWYSVLDGFRLTIAQRHAHLHYTNTRQYCAPGNEYSSIRQNDERIFLADPYHISQFGNALAGDIDAIIGANYSPRRSQAWANGMPETLIMPLLANSHWHTIRVKIAYPVYPGNVNVSILWDDPFGNLSANLRQQLGPTLRTNIEKLIKKQLGNTATAVFTDTVKALDQQGRGNNGYDCGPITFSNINDYLRNNNRTNEQIIANEAQFYTASAVTNPDGIRTIRNNHAQMCGNGGLDNAVEQSLKANKATLDAVKESTASKISQFESSQSKIMQQINSLPPHAIDKVFEWVEINRLAVPDSKGKPCSDKELEVAYAAVKKELDSLSKPTVEITEVSMKSTTTQSDQKKGSLLPRWSSVKSKDWSKQDLGSLGVPKQSSPSPAPSTMQVDSTNSASNSNNSVVTQSSNPSPPVRTSNPTSHSVTPVTPNSSRSNTSSSAKPSQSLASHGKTRFPVSNSQQPLPNSSSTASMEIDSYQPPKLGK